MPQGQSVGPLSARVIDAGTTGWVQRPFAVGLLQVGQPIAVRIGKRRTSVANRRDEPRRRCAGAPPRAEVGRRRRQRRWCPCAPPVGSHYPAATARVRRPGRGYTSTSRARPNLDVRPQFATEHVDVEPQGSILVGDWDRDAQYSRRHGDLWKRATGGRWAQH